MLSSNVSGDTTFRTRTRGKSRWATLGGVLGVVLISLGMAQTGGCPLFGPRVTKCPNGDADCVQTDLCKVGTCGADGNCAVTDKTCSTGQECDTADGACKTPCTADADCNDGDGCTVDACGTDGFCTTSGATDCDDADACTVDTCVPATGCVHTDKDCNDNVACTDDACAAGTCTNTDNCGTGKQCNATTGACDTLCTTDAECDDTVFCNGAETCGADGVCVAGTDPCTDNGVFCDGTESCDEATAACVSSGDPCVAAGQLCDEATAGCLPVAACTDDAGCDDGVFCNGAETCDLTDPANGVCADGTRPCADTKADGTVGVCTDAGVTETCSEGDTAAVCTACPTVTVDFTIGLDNLTGTAGDDTFYAAWDYTSGGTKVNTLDTGDTANGLAGADVLNATFVGASSTIVPILTGIETINITDNGSGTTNLKLGSSSGVTTVNSVSSTAVATITDIGTAVNLGISNTDMGIAATYKAAATSGTADALTLTLSDVPDATTSVATITTDSASGFETINVVTAGTTTSVLRQLATAGNTTTLKTMNVSGTKSVTLRTIPSSLTTTISASGLTSPAAFQLGNGTSITGSSAYTTFQTMDVGNLTGGPGNDVFIFAGTLTSSDADGTTEYIDGGAGTDVLQASLGASISSAPHIKNIEEFRLNATGDYTLACPTIAAGSALTTITIESDATSSGSQNTLTLSSVPYQPASSTALPALAYRGNGAEGNQYFDAVTYTGSGVSSGSSDSLAITVGNRGTDLGTTSSSNAYNVGLITASGIETLTITVTDVPVTGSTATTFNGITATGMTSLTVTSEDDVILGTIVGKTIGLATVDLSAASRIRSTTNITTLATSAVVTLTADNDTVTITGGTAQTGITVNCGAGDDVITTGADTNTYTLNGEAGDDTLTGQTGVDTINGSDGNDTIVGGGGADTLSGGAGNDTITGGSGVDTISGGDGNDTITGAAGADLITGGAGVDTYVFTDDATNGIDVFTLESGDLDGTAIDDVFSFAAAEDLIGATADIATICSSANIVTTACSGLASGDNIVILTGAYYANAAAVVAADTSVGLAALDAGDILLIYSSDATSAARIMVATVSGAGDVTAGNDVAVITGLTVTEASTGFANANFTTD